MSFFGKLFGGKKEDQALTTGDAIQKLRETEEMLVKKEEYLEKKIDIELKTAKKNASTNKRGIKYSNLWKFSPHHCIFQLQFRRSNERSATKNN